MRGLIQASHQGGEAIFAPRALIERIARILEGVDDLTADRDNRSALRNDAIIAKAGSKAHRWPPSAL